MAKQTIQIADKPTVDEILALLEDAENGLAAIKTLLGISADAASVEAVKSLLENGTYGLSALKAKADEINTNVDNTFNLVSNKGDDIINRLDNSTYGLNVIKTAITGRANESTATAIKALLENTTYGLNAIKTQAANANSYANTAASKSTSILTMLQNSTYGLSALKNAITGNLKTIKSVQSGIVTTTNSTSYYDVTISTVDLNKAFVIPQPATSSSTSNGFACYLLDSTTLRIYAILSANIKLLWQVVEFY